MITLQDIEDMGYDYYGIQMTKDDIMDKDRLYNMTPLDMVCEFVEVTRQEPNPALYALLIQEEFEEWVAEQKLGKPVTELKELADLVYVIYGYAAAKGWDLDEALRRVHQNNLGRCFRQDGTVERREDGKIMKDPNYPKVSLGDLV